MQDAIKPAAAKLFVQREITGTSVRDIAAAAGVDPAIAIRHIGSKEALFLQTMTIEEDLRDLAGGPVETLGRSILRRIFEAPEGSSVVASRALLGALDRPDVRAYVQNALTRQLVEPIRARLTGDDRSLRARLITAQIVGLVLTVAVSPRPVLDAAPLSVLLDVYAPALQLLIDEQAT